MDLDLLDKIKNIFSQGKQNLQDWGRVATDKTLRQDFSKHVIQPQINKAQEAATRNVSLDPKEQIQSNLQFVGRAMQKFPELKLRGAEEITQKLEGGSKAERLLAMQPGTARALTEGASSFLSGAVKDTGRTLEKVGKGEKLNVWDWLNLTDFVPGLGFFAAGVKPVVREGFEKVGKEGLEKVSKLTMQQLKKRFKGDDVMVMFKGEFMGWVKDQFGKKFDREIAEKSFEKAWKLADSPEDFAKRVSTQKQFTSKTSFKDWVSQSFKDWGIWYKDVDAPHPAGVVEEVEKIGIRPVKEIPTIKIKPEPKVSIVEPTNVSARLKSVREGKVSFDDTFAKDAAQAIDQTDFMAKYDDLGKYLQTKEGADRRRMVDMLTNKIPPSSPLEKQMAEKYRLWIADMSLYEKLGEAGKVRKNYWPSISLDQVDDPILDDLFPKSRISQAMADLPHLETKTKPNWLGDASLYDTFVFRSKAAVTHAYKYADIAGGVKPIDLTSAKPIIDQVQDAVPLKEEIKDFTGKIGIFQKTKLPEPVKDIFKKWTGLVEGPWTGGLNDMGLQNLMEPIYRGRVENFKWRSDMYSKIQNPEYRKNAWTFLNDLAEKLKFEKDSDSWNQLVKATFDKTRMYGNTERTFKLMVDRVGDQIHIENPIKALENWIGKNNIIDTESKDFFEKTVKNILTKEQKTYSAAMEALSTVRRVQYLGVIGMKPSTAIYQLFETVRAIARYPKHAPRALADSFTKSKYAHFKDEASLKRYFGGERISNKTYQKVLEKMEDVGYFGIKTAESWKDNVFLRAAELDGLAKGKSGDALDSYVWREFREFAHKYSIEDLGVIMKNPIAKMAFMFQTYGVKNISHLLRSVDRLMTGPNKKKEAAYLALYLVGSLGVYETYKHVFKSKRALLDVVTGGIPSTFNPLIDLGNSAYQYSKLSKEDKEKYKGEKLKAQMKRQGNMNIPFGNQAFNVTGRTIGDIQRGYSETYTGNVAHPGPQTTSDKARSLIISPYSNEYSQKYFKDEIGPLGKNQSELYRQAIDKVGFYEQVQSSKEENKKVLGIKAEMEENQGGDAIETQGRIIYWDEEEGKVKSISKVTYEKSIVDGEYSLTADRLKRADDYVGWVENAEGYIQYLQKFMGTLDPLYEKDDAIRLQNKIEDIRANIDKYTGYGGFIKPKKPKAPKKITGKKITFKAPKTASLKTRALPTVKLTSAPEMKAYKSKPIKITTTVDGIPAIKVKPVDYSIHIVG